MFSEVNRCCLFLSLQEANADEFEDKEWTFVIEGVSITVSLTKLYRSSELTKLFCQYYIL